MGPSWLTPPIGDRKEQSLRAESTLDLDSARILVAEDDELSRRLTTTVLERAGYGVMTVVDGASVVRALEEHAADLLLCDVGLPTLDGLEVSRLLRADPRFATLPILLLTGRTDEADIVSGFDAGADDYLAKPVRPRVLLARVRGALRSRRALLGMEAAHAVVAALANAIDAKDMLTERHSRRLSTYATALGRDIGLEPADLHAVAYGALLHDVGKIGVPEAVLLKPGPLNDSDWQLMRRHTEIGERIAAPLVGSAKFGPIIRHHHERWDGRGYPDGLQAEAIPIGARIITVVDAFDAMTQARVYRPARSVGEAIEELRRGRGTQFDPDLTDAFLRIVEWGDPLDGPGPPDEASAAGRSPPPEPEPAAWR
ncbi:MAG: HD domain-containing phosphohydrolase [Chloroflexota bacterium]